MDLVKEEGLSLTGESAAEDVLSGLLQCLLTSGEELKRLNKEMDQLFSDEDVPAEYTTVIEYEECRRHRRGESTTRTNCTISSEKREPSRTADHRPY